MQIAADSEESPTVALDSSPKIQPINTAISPDPFRDVIKTEPAPDLPSLMEDMMPHFADRDISTREPTTSTESATEVLPDVTTEKNAAETFPDSILDPSGSSEVPHPGEFQENKPTASTSNGAVIGTTIPTPGDETTTLSLAIMAPQRTTAKLPSKPSEKESPGLLKLAGCNIYGRMYRVGKIIVELSGPCAECKCTETGVQCNQLAC